MGAGLVSLVSPAARLLAALIAVALYAAPAEAALRVAFPTGGPAVIEIRASTSAVRTLLEQRGYLVIGKVRLTGGVYRVWAIDPKGRKVELLVDPSSVRILRKIYPKK